MFELTLNGDAPENQPLAIVASDYGYSDGWKHNGVVVEGVQTKKFKLVEIGYCPNWQTVLDKLSRECGNIPEGQWREAFKKQFSTFEKGPIGFPDASWIDPHGNTNFPCVVLLGSSSFHYSDLKFYEIWRWLVFSK